MTEPSATEFTPNYVWFANQGAYYIKDATQTTSTSVFYEMKTRDSSGNDTTPVWMAGQYGIEFRYENGGTVLYCNTGNNNDIPYTFANGAVSQSISVGYSVTATMADGSTAYTFTVISGMLWTSSGGDTGTEGVSVANGSITRDAFGALYFTVDKSSPLTVGTHDYGFYLDGFLRGTINHSLSTLDAIGYQNNPSDGLWQLSYQGGSSVQVLASYVIGRNKKVHANFW